MAVVRSPVPGRLATRVGESRFTGELVTDHIPRRRRRCRWLALVGAFEEVTAPPICDRNTPHGQPGKSSPAVLGTSTKLQQNSAL